jgi:hypothetical protein
MAGLDRRASAAPAVAQTMTQQRQRRVMESVMTVFLAHSKRRLENDYNPDHGILDRRLSLAALRPAFVDLATIAADEIIE